MSEISRRPGRRWIRVGISLLCLWPALLAAADGYLRVANPGNPASLDPHKITGVWENRIVGDMFVGLTTEGPDGSVQPGAAARWEVSGDGLTWHFWLRPHSWSDGQPVTAADFVYSFRRMLAPETACLYADFFFPIEGAQAYTGGDGPAEAVGVAAIAPDHLQIQLRRPVAYFPGLLMHFAAMPVPRQAIEAHDEEWTRAGNIVVNGPFIVSERVPNDRVTLRRNPRFFAADDVELPGVVYFSQENREAAVQRYRTGELEVLRDFPASKVGWLRETFGTAVHTEPYLGLTYVVINHRRAPLDDVRVREALSLALHREIIVERVLGSGERAAWSLVPPGTAHYGPPERWDYADWPRERRVTRARELMRAAGYDEGRPLELSLRLRLSDNERRVAVAAQAMWRDIFVEAELLRAETAIHYSRLQAGDFDLGLASWLAVYDDPQTFTLLAQTGAGSNNLGRYRNARYDALTEQAARTVDLDARAVLLHEAEALALADHALLPVFHHVSRNLVSPAVSGWQSNMLDMHRSRYLRLN
jgi:oligopeptide transport system substrate-binding protein